MLNYLSDNKGESHDNHHLPVSVPQINDSKIVWEVVRILVEAKPESKHIIKALLKAAVVSERLFIFPHDGVIAFEAGTY